MKRFFITALLGVTLIGVIAIRTFHRRHSQGLSVGILTTQCSSPVYLNERCRLVRLRIVDDGGLFINDDPESVAGLPSRLADVYYTRNERVLFFDAADSVSYQQVVNAIDIAQSAVPGLRVILITPRTRHECEQLWAPNGGGAAR